MNKNGFAIELARMTNMPKAAALRMTNAMLDILSKTLHEKETIRLSGFGTIEVRRAPERMARNPRTNEPAVVPERYKPVFRPSKQMLGRMNREEL